MSTVPALEELSESQVDEFIGSLSDEEVIALEYDWRVWARPEQIPPEEKWRGWLLLAGRGAGKTRSGAEWVLDPDGSGKGPPPDDRIALVAPTTADVRDVMVEGESGILECSPPWNRPHYEPSKRRLTWKNGAIATTFSADQPDRLRGPQFTRAWADEIASWRYGPDTWSNLMFALRLGRNPQWVATTTPKPVRVLRELIELDGVVTTKMTTYDNRANLADAFLDEIIRRYEGTRLGRQELLAELLEDVPGALWHRAEIEEARVDDPPEFERVVVAIDPAVTSGEDADETGIVVAAKAGEEAYVLSDLTCRDTPKGWAKTAIGAYYSHTADRVVAEVNNGGDLVEDVLRTVDPNVAYKAVRASRGKRVRAEPIAALYEQGRVKHVGTFPDLEDQMCTYVPDVTDTSPDRVDALVWALSELMLGAVGFRIRSLD